MAGKKSFIGFENQAPLTTREMQAYAQGRIDASNGVTYNANKFPRDPIIQTTYQFGHQSWTGDTIGVNNPVDAAGRAYPHGGGG